MKEAAKNILKLSADFCKNSYFTEKMNEEGFEYIFNVECGLDCFIKASEGITWIVFRGTEVEKVNDVCTDLMIGRTSAPFFPSECRIHSGFLMQYTSCRLPILGKVIELGNETVICCGHSLGGALATICALDVETNLEDDYDVYCVTFGSPRVGGKHFTRLFDTEVKNSYRLVDANDPIPRVPFRSMGFRHVRGCYAATENGLYPDYNKETSKLASCSSGDHSMENYETAVSLQR